MNAVALANALHALAPSGVNAFQGEAPGDTSAPWIVTSLEDWAPIEGEVGTLPAGTHIWRVTVVGDTWGQCLGWVGQCVEAWRNARVEVAGMSVGALRGPSVSGPYRAGLTALDTNLRYQVAQVRFTLTVS